MLKSAFILAVAIFVSEPSGLEKKPTNPNNSYVFQCGALYGILMKAYQEAKDDEKTGLYRRKFDILALMAEKQFEKSNRSKAEAEEFMQKHVDDLVRLSLKDKSTLLQFKAVCDNIFP